MFKVIINYKSTEDLFKSTQMFRCTSIYIFEFNFNMKYINKKRHKDPV